MFKYNKAFPQMTILDAAKSHIHASTNAWLESDNWKTALDNMGIKTSLPDAILDPRFDQMRFTESAAFGVIETISAKWLYLTTLEITVLKSKNQDKRE